MSGEGIEGVGHKGLEEGGSYAGDEDDADTLVKENPDVLSFFFEHDHLPAANYRMWCGLTLEEAWFDERHRALAVHLMGREPDGEIAEE